MTDAEELPHAATSDTGRPGSDGSHARQAGQEGGKSAEKAGLVASATAAFTAYLDGDRSAMGTLVDLLNPLLWHTARGQGLARTAAEDVVQTAWLRLCTHADKVESPEAVTAWLMTTVRRESWRAARKSGKEDLTEVEPEGMDPEPGPELGAVLSEQQGVLWRHVAQLTPRCQHLLRIIAFADRPDYATIADTLGMAVGSIGPTRGRCLTALREALEDDPHWDGEVR